MPGRVLRSGITTEISHVKENIRSQWLTGGWSVWRKDILVNNKHKEIKTKWAIAEDVIFSYPIGKVFPLYVCASAIISHNDYPYDTDDKKWHFFHGRTQTIWNYHFVHRHKELSRVLFFYTVFIRVFGKLIYGIITRRHDLVSFSHGAISAVAKIIKYFFTSTPKSDLREFR